MESEVTTGISLMFLPSSEQGTVFLEQTENVHYSSIWRREEVKLVKLVEERSVLLSGKEGAAHSDDQAVHPPTRTSLLQLPPSINIYTISSLVFFHVLETCLSSILIECIQSDHSQDTENQPIDRCTLTTTWRVGSDSSTGAYLSNLHKLSTCWPIRLENPQYTVTERGLFHRILYP